MYKKKEARTFLMEFKGKEFRAKMRKKRRKTKSVHIVIGWT